MRDGAGSGHGAAHTSKGPYPTHKRGYDNLLEGVGIGRVEVFDLHQISHMKKVQLGGWEHGLHYKRASIQQSTAK